MESVFNFLSFFQYHVGLFINFFFKKFCSMFLKVKVIFLFRIRPNRYNQKIFISLFVSRIFYRNIFLLNLTFAVLYVCVRQPRVFEGLLY